MGAFEACTDFISEPEYDFLSKAVAVFKASSLAKTGGTTSG